MYPIESLSVSSCKDIFSFITEQLKTKAFIIFSILLSLMIGFVTACGFFLAGPPIFIVSGICFALLVSVVSFFGCRVLTFYGKQYFLSYTKSIPSLSPSLIDFLKTEPKGISSLFPHPNLQNCFQGACPEYKQFFFENPDKLLSAALIDWTPQIVPSDSHKTSTVILRNPYLPFSITLSTLNFELLHTYLAKSNELTCQLSYAHQLPPGNPVVRQGRKGVFLQSCNEGASAFFIPIQETQTSLDQEESFKRLFTYYVQIIEHSLSTGVLLLEPLKTPLQTPKARALELLALFCALEQLRYATIAEYEKPSASIHTQGYEEEEGPSLAPIYPLDYKDFFTLFMKKQCYTLPCNVSNMRILSPERPASDTELTTIILSGLEEKDKLGLLGQIKPFLFNAQYADPEAVEAILIQNVLDDIS